MKVLIFPFKPRPTHLDKSIYSIDMHDKSYKELEEEAVVLNWDLDPENVDFNAQPTEGLFLGIVNENVTMFYPDRPMGIEPSYPSIPGMITSNITPNRSPILKTAKIKRVYYSVQIDGAMKLFPHYQCKVIE